MKKVVRRFVTERVLTQGITSINGEIKDGYFWYGRWLINVNLADAHETLEAAQARAEQLRRKKIASLKKQIAKIEALTFDQVVQK